MQTVTARTTGLRAVILTASLALALAACGGAAATPPATTGPTAIPPVTAPPPTAVPGSTDAIGIGTGDGTSGSGSGGSSGGSTGGVVAPPPPEPMPGDNGGNPEPTFVTITEGLTDVHAVAAVNASAAVKGRHVALQVEWWSGVEPCNALAGVLVQQDGADFTVTVNEGVAKRGVMCVELAVYKGFTVDLGDLDAGTYLVNVFGISAPITVEVTG